MKIASILSILSLILLVSCTQKVDHDSRIIVPYGERAGTVNAATPHSSIEASSTVRKQIHKASQTIEVDDLGASELQIEKTVEERDGHIEASSVVDQKRRPQANITARIPASQLRSAMDEFAALGKETYRLISMDDTTEAYLDLEAKIANTRALRDRLRQLLDEAEEISEILKIEKELARVQAELDSLEGRLRLMKNQVHLTTLKIRLDERRFASSRKS